MEFLITEELILRIKEYIQNNDSENLEKDLSGIHYADIAELLEELSFDEAIYVFKILDVERTSELLLELDEDTREAILNRLSAKEIAEEIDELDTDDAADIISELPPDKKEEVIQELNDSDHARDIVELLQYDENTAGGLMEKEFIKVNENWDVLRCVREMRIQAVNVSKIHSIYVIDDNNLLKGRLSLKDLLTTSSNRNVIKDIYIDKIEYVNVDTEDVEVARIMQKYDLEAIPVIDEVGRLVGRITIDDIIDVIREEADRDYQLAAGISNDVEADDSIWDLTRARLPWLVLALFGGFIAVKVSGMFEDAMDNYKILFFFPPLIAAMAGNVGVQSSAIIVQGLANKTLTGTLWQRMAKEITLSILNGVFLSILLVIFCFIFLKVDYLIIITVALALISVILIASMIGTFVPITLNKYKIDPALATGPFITTSNDIFGIWAYFSIAKLILGF